jgi:hypothetical protein
MKLFAAVLFAAAAFAAEPGFHPLFNGKDLDGWKLIGGRGPGYVVEKGIIVCPADGGGNLFTGKEYGNFVLRLDFRLSEGGNNGDVFWMGSLGLIFRSTVEIYFCFFPPSFVHQEPRLRTYSGLHVLRPIVLLK